MICQRFLHRHLDFYEDGADENACGHRCAGRDLHFRSLEDEAAHTQALGIISGTLDSISIHAGAPPMATMFHNQLCPKK